MPQSLNLVQIIGRVGRDPEMRFVAEGQAVTTFSLATDRRVAKTAEGGQAATEADWHRIVCWGKLAEIANEFLTKGRLVYVAGRLAYRTWTGKDGQPRSGVEIVAHDLVLLDRRPGVGGTEHADQPVEGADAYPF